MYEVTVFLSCHRPAAFVSSEDQLALVFKLFSFRFRYGVHSHGWRHIVVANPDIAPYVNREEYDTR